MIRAVAVKRKGDWARPAVSTVVLAYQDRHRRRLAMHSADGLDFLLDLPRATALRGGDALELEDGRLVAVEAAAEPVLKITCSGADHQMRLAWHLGNRHLPTQIDGGALIVLEDHVIAEMARGLGADVQLCQRAFDPEGGAYGPDGVGHGHSHGNSQNHEHSHE